MAETFSVFVIVAVILGIGIKPGAYIWHRIQKRREILKKMQPYDDVEHNTLSWRDRQALKRFAYNEANGANRELEHSAVEVETSER